MNNSASRVVRAVCTHYSLANAKRTLGIFVAPKLRATQFAMSHQHTHHFARHANTKSTCAFRESCAFYRQVSRRLSSDFFLCPRSTGRKKCEGTHRATKHPRRGRIRRVVAHLVQLALPLSRLSSSSHPALPKDVHVQRHPFTTRILHGKLARRLGQTTRQSSTGALYSTRQQQRRASRGSSPDIRYEKRQNAQCAAYSDYTPVYIGRGDKPSVAYNKPDRGERCYYLSSCRASDAFGFETASGLHTLGTAQSQG